MGVNRDQPQVIGISGPSGAGKTLIAGYLRSMKNIYVVAEPIPLDLFEAFSQNPQEFCYILQCTFVEARQRLGQNANRDSTVIYDRTLAEDREIFFKLHYERGFLTEKEYKELCIKAYCAEEDILAPNVILFLEAEISILLDRLRKQFIPCWILDSIERQVELYETWLKTITVPVVRVNTSKLSIDELADLAIWTQAATEKDWRERSLKENINLQSLGFGEVLLKGDSKC